MKTPFDMSFVLAFGFCGLVILIGVFLRARIKLLQNYLVPSCMIGGLLGMILLNFGLIPLGEELFQAIAYHFFILSFISIGLTRGEQSSEGEGGRGVLRGALWMGLINGMSMSTQALLGCVLILGLWAAGFSLPLEFGLFLPLGYTQGPGQALAIGKAWEAGGFADAVTIGLAFAALGFFFALFVGVPLINWGVRKGYVRPGSAEGLPAFFKKGYYAKEEQTESMGVMTTHPGNVDSLAFQAGLVGVVYGGTYLLYFGLSQVVGSLSDAAWGFFFFWGLLVGLLSRLAFQKAGAGHMIDPGTQTRITGFCVDILVAATLIAVKLSVVWEYIVPLVLIALVGGVWTTLYMLYFGRRCEGHGFERMIVQYGCNTGTVSTGLVLLRVVDPYFKTTVAFETGLYSIFATPFILGTMLFIVYSPKWGLGIYQQMGVYLGLTLVGLILLKVFGLWHKKRW
ncbi:MAG: hypothetical protein MUC76_08210 [Spirochaetes bacterium]|jgi:ESS family glutamate:Na+ symporter|nr:hypothetical protein [Spirochaetota bacterium]